MKRLAVLAGLTMVLIGAVACGSSTPGQPAPATTADGQSSDGSPVTTSTSGGSAGSLPVSQPCSLLSSTDLQQIDVSSQPIQDMVGTAHACELDNADDHIIVGIRTNVGLAGLAASKSVSDIQVGGHAAKEMRDAGASSCLVAIGVSDSSRVDVTATGDGNTDPCPTALIVAKLVEPKLP